MESSTPDDILGTEPKTAETEAARAERTPREWSEEQLRYRVLLAVYAETGGRCDEEISGDLIGPALGLRWEDLYRVIHYLEYNGFLDYLGAGPRVCITRKGIEYLRQNAWRRRSIRTSGTWLRKQQF